MVNLVATVAVPATEWLAPGHELRNQPQHRDASRVATWVQHMTRKFALFDPGELRPSTREQWDGFDHRPPEAPSLDRGTAARL